MAKQRLHIGIFFMSFCCLVNCRTPTKLDDTLELLHVIFRHGDRTQDYPSYPNDPYQNYSFYPVGIGQLTEAGKRRVYNIGVYLRQIYNDFLTETYFPGILAANSSAFIRCRTSMELVLAGLYPPAVAQQWSNLNWQPIPYDYKPTSQDFLFASKDACPNFKRLMKKFWESKKYKEVYESYTDVLDYLQKNSGFPSKINIALTLYSTLRSQDDWPVELPRWCKNVWPEPINEITQLDWKHHFPTEETRTLGAGFLMSKIVHDSKLKLARDPQVKDMKIYLYSGHDTNIAAVLTWLGAEDLHTPEYGSFILFEIHTLIGVPHITVIYQNYENSQPQEIYIPNCGFYCPFQTFVDLYAAYLNPEPLCN